MNVTTGKIYLVHMIAPGPVSYWLGTITDRTAIGVQVHTDSGSTVFIPWTSILYITIEEPTA